MNDYYKYQMEKEARLKEQTRKELLKIYRKHLTIISKITLKNIKVSMDIMFGTTRTSEFSITIYNNDGDNRTLTIYDFHEIERSKKALATLVDAIKQDSFEKIEAVKLSV